MRIRYRPWTNILSPPPTLPASPSAALGLDMSKYSGGCQEWQHRSRSESESDSPMDQHLRHPAATDDVDKGVDCALAATAVDGRALCCISLPAISLSRPCGGVGLRRWTRHRTTKKKRKRASSVDHINTQYSRYSVIPLPNICLSACLPPTPTLIIMIRPAKNSDQRHPCSCYLAPFDALYIVRVIFSDSISVIGAILAPSSPVARRLCASSLFYPRICRPVPIHLSAYLYTLPILPILLAAIRRSRFDMRTRSLSRGPFR